jgi:hypothetical protein
VSAVTHIWNIQKDFENNPHSSPRGFIVKKLLKALKKEADEDNDATFKDRQQGTMEDSITEGEYVEIGKYFYDRNNCGHLLNSSIGI